MRKRPPMHQRGSPRRTDQHCRNGHDLTLPDAIVLKNGVEACRACVRDGLRRYRQTHTAAPVVTYHHCTKCGRPKWLDERPVCLSCRAEVMRDSGVPPAQVDALLDDAVLLESAPGYIRRDKTEHGSWLAWKRKQLRGEQP